MERDQTHTGSRPGSPESRPHSDRPNWQPAQTAEDYLRNIDDGLEDYSERRMTTTAKRAPGRPKGTPRTGGRAPGTPNKKNQVSRDFVIKEGAPLAFLCSVVRGRRFTAASEQGDSKRTHIFPTLDQRIRAAEVLSRKCLPDLKATELTGKDGGAVALSLMDFLKGLPA